MTVRENLMRILRRNGTPEWVPYGFDSFDFISPTEMLRERPFHCDANGEPTPGDGYDWFGCFWHWDASTHGYAPIPGKKPVQDVTLWREQVVFPDLDAVDWENGSQKICAQLDRENKASFFMLESGPWERAHALLGFQEALMYLYTEPEALKALLCAITDFRVEMIHRIAKHIHPDIVVSFDDFGHQMGTFMSREMFLEFIFPQTKRIAEAVHSHGMIYCHHSCGKIQSLVGDILDAGADMILGCYAPYNDVAEIERQYGDRVVIMGGSNNQYLDDDNRTETEIREAVRQDIDRMAPYKNLIFDAVIAGHPERQQIVGDEVRRYGANYWKK